MKTAMKDKAMPEATWKLCNPATHGRLSTADKATLPATAIATATATAATTAAATATGREPATHCTHFLCSCHQHHRCHATNTSHMPMHTSIGNTSIGYHTCNRHMTCSVLPCMIHVCQVEHTVFVDVGTSDMGTLPITRRHILIDVHDHV